MSTETSKKRLGLLSELEEYIKDSAELTKLEKFISEALDDRPIQHYFVWQAMEKPLPDKAGEPVETIKVTIVSDNIFFEFVYSTGRYRYDVQPLDVFFRIEEIHYTETNLSGETIPLMKAEINGKYGELTQNFSVKGEKVKQLKEFLRAIRQLIPK